MRDGGGEGIYAAVPERQHKGGNETQQAIHSSVHSPGCGRAVALPSWQQIWISREGGTSLLWLWWYTEVRFPRNSQTTHFFHRAHKEGTGFYKNPVEAVNTRLLGYLYNIFFFFLTFYDELRHRLHLQAVGS